MYLHVYITIYPTIDLSTAFITIKKNIYPTYFNKYTFIRTEFVNGANEKSLRDTEAILKLRTRRAHPSIPTLKQ